MFITFKCILQTWTPTQTIQYNIIPETNYYIEQYSNIVPDIGK